MGNAENIQHDAHTDGDGAANDAHDGLGALRIIVTLEGNGERNDAEGNEADADGTDKIQQKSLCLVHGIDGRGRGTHRIRDGTRYKGTDPGEALLFSFFQL